MAKQRSTCEAITKNTRGIQEKKRLNQYVRKSREDI